MPQRHAPTARSSSRSSKRSDAAIAVGEIVGAHALKGMVRVRAYQPPVPSLRAGRAIVLEHGGMEREARVCSAAPHGRGLVLVQLEGIAGRDAAEALVGARVLVHAVDLPPAAEGEFYYHEITGFSVETTAGEPLGTVAETFTTGLNDVWVVRGGRREYLIPVIADVVRLFDRDAARIVIEPMPGLLD